MSNSLNRNDLVRRARFVPKTFAGAGLIAGYLGAIAALVVLISGDFGWIVPSTALLVGVAVMSVSGLANQKAFRRAASNAGFDAAAIREIENEAERLTRGKG